MEAENPNYTTGFNIHSIFTKTTIYCLGALCMRGLSLCIALTCQIKTYNKWHKPLFKTSVINRHIFWKISVLNLEVLDTVKVYSPPSIFQETAVIKCLQTTTTSFHIPSNLPFTNHSTSECNITYTPGKMSLNKPIIIHCVKWIRITVYIVFCTDVKCLY